MKLALAAVALLTAFASAACADDATDLGAQRAEDIAAFRTDFFDVTKSYDETERAEAESLLATLAVDAPDLSDAEFNLRLAQVVALAHNGHSMLFASLWDGAFAQVPMRFLVTDDGLFVGEAIAPFENLVGARVVEIDGQSWEDLQSAWTQYSGGRKGIRNQYIYYFLETPAILHAAGLGISPEQLTLTVEQNGEAETVDVPATDELPGLEGIEAYLPPMRLAQIYAETSAVNLPLWLQDPSKNYRYAELQDLDTAYVQFRANSDHGDEDTIHEFVAETEARLRTLSPRFIILDERANMGGDLNETRDLMQALPSLLGENGHIYILTSGRTFSAGISSVGYAKQAAGDVATIAGAPVGDYMEFWAEGDLVELPNSGISFLTATERHNYQTGCPEDDCHSAIRLHPIAVPSLDPDVDIPFTFADFRDHRDPVLDWVRADIAARLAP